MTRWIVDQEDRLALLGDARFYPVDQELKVFVFVAPRELRRVRHAREARKSLARAETQEGQAEVDAAPLGSVSWSLSATLRCSAWTKRSVSVSSAR